jgi:N-acetylglutamate synthase-like GNAT family acetyltransferase
VEARIDAARAGDTEAVFRLLALHHLPPDGLASHLATTLVARQDGGVVGSAALEVYPDGALLRSVAVAPEAQGHGLGGRLTDAAIRLAQDLQLPALYLLTTTAERYFPTFGFEPIARADVRATVQTSVEFRPARRVRRSCADGCKRRIIMATRIGINGFGRMGRLALRAGWGRPDLQFVHVNEISGGPETAAHLLTFDSVHGRWDRRVEARDGQVAIDGVGWRSPTRRRRERRRGRRIRSTSFSNAAASSARRRRWSRISWPESRRSSWRRRSNRARSTSSWA